MRCNNCGFYNPAGVTRCVKCNYVYEKCKSIESELFSERCYFEMKNECIIPFDIAPDGIDRYIHVKSDIPFLRNIIENFINSKNPKEYGYLELLNENYKSIDDIQKLLNKISKAIIKNEANKIYLTYNDINRILPRTLLSQILNVMSFASIPAISDKTLSGTKQIFSNKCFGISLQSKDNFVFSYKERNNLKIPKRILISYPYIEESFDLLKSLKSIEFIEKEYETQFEGMTELKNEKQLTDFHGNKNLYKKSIFDGEFIMFSVEINELLVLFRNVIVQIGSLHLTGNLHCDLKPENILVAKTGMTFIDSLNIPVKHLSHSYTLNYCAPELELELPVTYSTDIYSIGKILLLITNANVTWEERVYRGKHTKRLKVYPIIEYSSVNESTEKWKKLIEKCLKFYPNERFSNISELLNSYDILLKDLTFEGRIEFNSYFGRLKLHNNQPIWLLEDFAE